MDKRWQLTEPIDDAWRDKFPELHPLTVQLLKNRGIETQQQVDEFLLPDYGENLHDPFLFRKMELVCQRIWSAIEDGERLTVFGDYDADGVCGTAILLTTFRQVADLCGSDPELIDSYIPHREYEGYGLNDEAVRSIADSGSQLIITVDCGISNAAEVELVHQLGLDIIVTDHHQVPERVPNCLIIHPLVPGENYPYDCLAGAGVAFKLAAAFLDYARQQGLEIPIGQEKWLLDLVAIATVTDFMKLVGENRTLEKWGLVVLNKTRRPGLRKLIEVAGLELGKLDTVSVGYYLGPRINAASRMEHADLALETLLIKDETQAADLARKLNLCNADRQRVTEEIYRQAIKMFVPDKKVQVIVGAGWSAGVVGIVAGKLVTDWGVPVFVLSEQEDGRIVGSGRGIKEFDLVDLLRDSANFLARYGGHPEACGLTIESRENLADFTAQAWQYAEEKLADRDLRPMLQLDAELSTDQITWDLINELERFEPFGIGNPKPLFLIKNAKLISAQPVGKDGKHVRVSARGVGPRELKLIGFGFAERVAAFIPGEEIDVVAELGVNEWNGTKSIQVRMVDLRRSQDKKRKARVQDDTNSEQRLIFRRMKKLIIHTDGGARGNPGPAGIGVLIEDENGNTVLEHSRYIGETTNNQAEYSAVIDALQHAKGLGATEVAVFLDSELVVRQLNGEYKVKDPGLAQQFLKVHNLRCAFRLVTFTHVRRELNKRADRLANEAMDRLG